MKTMITTEKAAAWARSEFSTEPRMAMVIRFHFPETTKMTALMAVMDFHEGKGQTGVKGRGDQGKGDPPEGVRAVRSQIRRRLFDTGIDLLELRDSRLDAHGEVAEDEEQDDDGGRTGQFEGIFVKCQDISDTHDGSRDGECQQGNQFHQPFPGKILADHEKGDDHRQQTRQSASRWSRAAGYP